MENIKRAFRDLSCKFERPFSKSREHYFGMLKLFAFSALIILRGIALDAQPLRWAINLGGTKPDEPRAMTIDKDGNIYITGYFNATADFDPGEGVFELTSFGDKDIFILKLDPESNLIWARQMGGTWVDEGKAIALDKDGNIFIAGTFRSTADFDPGEGVFNLVCAGFDDAFITKLDKDGNFIWAKRFGGQDKEYVSYIATDVSGNAYLTGYFNGTVDFDPGEGSHVYTAIGDNASDIYILKLDANGNFKWAARMGSLYSGTGTSIAVDGEGNVISTGGYGGEIDFDPGPNAYYMKTVGMYPFNTYISKLDSSGNFIWAKSMGGKETTYPNGMAIDKLGNIYTTGYFRDTADFDPGIEKYSLVADGTSAGFISKLNKDGNFVWAKALGQMGSTAQGDLISADEEMNCYVIGGFRKTIDFDPGEERYELTTPDYGIFLLKLDEDGNFVWAKSMGGPYMDEAKGITLDDIGNMYTTGYFDSKFKFDTTEASTLSSHGSYDMFLTKHGTSTLNVPENRAWLNSWCYPNPTAGRITIHIGGYSKYSEVLVTNVVGQVVGKKQFRNTRSAEMDIEGAKGIYFLEITADNRRSVIRVLKY